VIWAEAPGSATSNHGMYRWTGASRSTFPASASCLTVSAVKDFETEPMSNGVCAVNGRPQPSARPKPRR
jgi:hypothetical protein